MSIRRKASIVLVIAGLLEFLALGLAVALNGAWLLFILPPLIVGFFMLAWASGELDGI